MHVGFNDVLQLGLRA